MHSEQPRPISSAESADAGIRALGGALRLSFRLLIVALGVLILGGLARCLVVTKPHETGIVYRFGKVVRVLKPKESGFVLPPPLNEYRSYTVKREQSLESTAFMFALTEAEKRTGRVGVLPELLAAGKDGYLLTGDGNIAHCQATVYYEVTDALRYYEMLAAEKKLLEAALNDCLVAITAGLPLEDVLLDVKVYTEAVTALLRKRCQELALGVEIKRLVLKPQPPRQVKEAFDAHFAVAQEVDQLIKEAKAYKSTTENAAESQASRVLAMARADKSSRVQSSAARAQTYEKLMADYQRNPQVLKREVYTETLRRVLEAAEEKFLIDGQKQRQIRLLLGRQAATAEPKAASEE